MTIVSRPYGRLPDGRSVERYVVDNGNGLAVAVITYGCTIVSLHAPDARGARADVVLGFDALEGYLGDHPYFGATIGRYANRIAHGRFVLDGTAYQLACNDGPNHLHGGRQGYGRKLWRAAVVEEAGLERLDMEYTSPDGEEGYPGTLLVRASHVLTPANELVVTYRARCDRRTIVNLTNHAYFHLGGAGGSPDVLDHVFELPARRFLPIDPTLIPLGYEESVAGTPMDFTSPVALRPRLAGGGEQLALAGGFDHTWALGHDDGRRLAARVREPRSGRVLEIETTQPGVQFYSGNQLDGTIVGKNGRHYVKHAGFCLEPHRFPDAPNRSAFPSAVLDAGAPYEQTTVYRFVIDRS